MDDLIIVDVEQGSEAWHALRKGKRTASITPMIMGTSKFMDAGDAYDLLLGDSDFTGNAATDYGNRMEPRARGALSLKLDVEGNPVVGYRGDYLASLDFLGDGLVADIKCPFSGTRSSTWKAALKGEIEPGYADQLEHQYRVFRPEKIGLFVYLNDAESVFVPYAPSEQRWGEIQRAWDQFWDKHILTFTRPNPYTVRDDAEWASAAERFIRMQQSRKAAEEQEEKFRAELIKLAAGRKSEGAGVRVNIYAARGAIDYKAALASVDPQFNAEPFRKAPATKTDVRLIKEEK